MVKTTTKSGEETRELAKDLAEKILASKNQPNARLVALVGDLGAGKTTFVQGFAKALGIKEKVVSPTFVILKYYRLHVSCFRNLIHIDAYRINDSKEIKDLGWKNMAKNSENIILIEWAENIKKILKKPYFLVNFEHGRTIYGEHGRTIDIKLIK